MMPPKIAMIHDAEAKAQLCRKITERLPMWFGRPDVNDLYFQEIRTRDVFVAQEDGVACGLIALEYHFEITCNVWWLGVDPGFHRRGLGRALMSRAVAEAGRRGCRQMAVETVSPRADSPEYEETRRFYEAVGFRPFIEFEPEPGDYMMWMLRLL